MATASPASLAPIASSSLHGYPTLKLASTARLHAVSLVTPHAQGGPPPCGTAVSGLPGGCLGMLCSFADFTTCTATNALLPAAALLRQ
jgi:hypothetical protein